MIIVTVKASPKAEKRRAFIDRMNELAATVRKEEGCITYSLFESPEDPAKVYLFEQWASKTALEAHLGQPHMTAHFEATADWFEAETDMAVYEASETALGE